VATQAVALVRSVFVVDVFPSGWHRAGRRAGLVGCSSGRAAIRGRSFPPRYWPSWRRPSCSRSARSRLSLDRRQPTRPP